MGPDFSDPMLWALVMNASRLRILRGLADDAPPELVSTASARHLREHLGGEPVVASEAIGADLTEFVRESLGCLAILRQAGDFEHLALVAPATVMSCTDKEMPPQLGPGVRWRHVADLVTLPDNELRAAVRRMTSGGAVP